MEIPVSVLLVTYNSNEFLKKALLRVIRAKNYPGEIIVFDNNSMVKPKKIIEDICQKRNCASEIRYVESEKNLGFARAVNKAIISSKYKWVLLLNPDFFVESESIYLLWKYALRRYKKNRIIAVGGKICKISDRRITDSIVNKLTFLKLLIEFTSLKKILHKIIGNDNISDFWDRTSLGSSVPIKVNAISACFLLVNRDDFISIDGFDDNYFLYLEDLDFSIKANKFGYNIYYFPRASGFHYCGGSSKDNNYKIDIPSWSSSKRYFCKKHFKVAGQIISYIFDTEDYLIKLKNIILK